MFHSCACVPERNKVDQASALSHRNAESRRPGARTSGAERAVQLAASPHHREERTPARPASAYGSVSNNRHEADMATTWQSRRRRKPPASRALARGPTEAGLAYGLANQCAPGICGRLSSIGAYDAIPVRAASVPLCDRVACIPAESANAWRKSCAESVSVCVYIDTQVNACGGTTQTLSQRYSFVEKIDARKKNTIDVRSVGSNSYSERYHSAGSRDLSPTCRTGLRAGSLTVTGAGRARRRL